VKLAYSFKSFGKTFAMQKNKNMLAFLDDVYEDLELWYPELRLEEAGYAMKCAAPESL
jgi:protease I